MKDNIITNQEINKRFPEIRYFINKWYGDNIDYTSFDTLCSEGLITECRIYSYYRDKQHAIDSWRHIFYRDLKATIANFGKDSGIVVIWRVKPIIQELKFDNIKKYNVYARYATIPIKIESF